MFGFTEHKHLLGIFMQSQDEVRNEIEGLIKTKQFEKINEFLDISKPETRSLSLDTVVTYAVMTYPIRNKVNRTSFLDYFISIHGEDLFKGIINIPTRSTEALTIEEVQS